MVEDFFEKDKVKHLQIKKNQILQKPGNITNQAFYVKSGLLRSYLYDDDGKMHIFMFAPEGWIVSDIKSHSLSEPAQLYIDALEDSEVVQLNDVSPDAFNSSKSDNIEVIQKLFKRIAMLQNRVILLMSANAMQRYMHFLETYPDLANRVPLKQIASYLGITPEALSKIRGQIK